MARADGTITAEAGFTRDDGSVFDKLSNAKSKARALRRLAILGSQVEDEALRRDGGASSTDAEMQNSGEVPEKSRRSPGKVRNLPRKNSAPRETPPPPPATEPKVPEKSLTSPGKVPEKSGINEMVMDMDNEAPVPPMFGEEDMGAEP